jgi:hypothetical protein
VYEENRYYIVIFLLREERIDAAGKGSEPLITNWCNSSKFEIKFIISEKNIPKIREKTNRRILYDKVSEPRISDWCNTHNLIIIFITSTKNATGQFEKRQIRGTENIIL